MLGAQWLLYARVFRPDALRRWLQLEVALQALVIGGAAAYLLLELRARPPGVAWGAPPVAALVASALGLQLVLFRLMRILRQG
ncbi:MAG TPA: hypothetical protein VF160_06650 [Candidatus Dormibacteraeota bacterium]